jgi:hypothetical protein
MYNIDLVVFLFYLYSFYHSLFLHNKVRKYDTHMSSSFGALFNALDVSLATSLCHSYFDQMIVSFSRQWKIFIDC